MTIQEITYRKEDQTFDCKGIQIEPMVWAIMKLSYTSFITFNN